jgi:hypothetical protein
MSHSPKNPVSLTENKETPASNKHFSRTWSILIGPEAIKAYLSRFIPTWGSIIILMPHNMKMFQNAS